MRGNHQNVLDSTGSAPMETHICRAPRAVGTVDETLWAFIERMWVKHMNAIQMLGRLMECCHVHDRIRR